MNLARLVGIDADMPASYTLLRQAYPPCVESLSELKSIRLRDLKMETHHTGRVLVVRSFFDPLMSAPLAQPSIVVVDEYGDVNYMAICNLWPRTPIEKLLPKNAFLAVKCPCFKKQVVSGNVIVQVDHPSDLVLLDVDYDSKLITSSMLTSAEAQGLPETKTNAQLKAKGNAAFKKGDWNTAVEH